LTALRPARIEARLTRPLPAGAALQFVATTGEVVDLAEPATLTVVDPADGAMLVWYQPQTPRLLAAGLRGHLRVAALSGTAVEVPARALLRRDGQATVLVQGSTGKAPQQHAVEVLAVSGPIALVRGLASGALVAAEADLVLEPIAAAAAPADASPSQQP
jgi:hypothetical protein